MFQFKSALCLAAICALCQTSSYADEYLEPDEIFWLPAKARQDLALRGCSVPTNIDGIYVSGVVTGQFAVAGQLDLAVICATEDEDFIFVYWGGEMKCASELSSFGEGLSVVGEHYILQQYYAYGGDKPPKIEHEAINDHVIGKASVVRYCNDGSWIELTGGD